jgi:glycosyltransferase involved in cell wall biosynthesis
MNILMQSRASLFRIPGGDTIQILKTKEYLEKRGVKVDVSLELAPDLSSYDLVHLFHFFRIHETFVQSLHAKKQNKKVVLSPIYVSRRMRDYFETHADLGYIKFINRFLGEEMRERVKGVWHYLKDKERNDATNRLITSGYRKLQILALKNIDAYLPNSNAEMNMFMEDFPGTYCYHVIPNAIDKQLFSAVVEWNKYEIPQDCVLCAARIEPRKNQLSLLKALRGTGLKLVLIGDSMPNRQAYYRQVKQCESSDLKILDGVPQNELIYLYAFAKVHALPSWFESPGLSSLEAAAMGCNIVASNQAIIKEYFKQYISYCEPGSVASIKDAVIESYHKDPDPQLRDYVLEQCSWEKTAELTLQAYEKTLNVS